MVVCTNAFDVLKPNPTCLFSNLDQSSADAPVTMTWVPSTQDFVTYLGYKGDLMYFINKDGYISIVEASSIQSYFTLGTNPLVTSEAVDDENYADALSTDLWVPARTSFSYRNADNSPPPIQEYRFVTKTFVTGTTNAVDENPLVCRSKDLWVYYTDLTLSFYFENKVVLLDWHRDIQFKEIGLGIEEVVSKDAQDVCENLCITESTVELCNENGICDPQSGECLCNFGWIGVKCDELAWIRIEQPITPTPDGNGEGGLIRIDPPIIPIGNGEGDNM